MVELKTRFPPWFDRSVRACLREKEIAFRAKKADPSPQNCRTFAERRAEFKELTNVKYREYLSSLIDNFKDNPKRYWTFSKTLKSSAKSA